MEHLRIDEIRKAFIQIRMEIDPDRLDWNHLRAFLATAETQSLSAAARKLGLTQPTLSRQISALEDSLSLMLFERVGRGLAITEAGRQLRAHASDMGLAAQRFSMTANGQQSDLTGWVRISASDILSAHVMPDIVAQIRQLAPQLRVDLVATNDISDLMRREADIAVRHVRPEQPDLVARLLKNGSGYFYGSKAFLDRVGRPKSKQDLGKMDWVAFGDADEMIRYLSALDIHLTAENCKVTSKNGLVAWEMAKAGFGLCPMDATVGDATLGMERVLPQEDEITFPLWLVAHREVHTNPKIRLVYDLLAQHLTQ